LATPAPEDAFSFKIPGGVLLTAMGALNGLSAFAQVLTDLIFAPWYLLLLSMVGLALALAVTCAGVWMLLRRWMPERLSPAAGIISTALLLAFLVAEQVITGLEVSVLVFPVALSIPIFVVVGRGVVRTRHLMPPKRTQGAAR
jgi:MFS family permease